MADWLFDPLICLLLLIVVMQLRGLRKQMAAQNVRKTVGDSDAELPLEAWIQELEAKGEEILSRIEHEKMAVAAAGAAAIREVWPTVNTALPAISPAPESGRPARTNTGAAHTSSAQPVPPAQQRASLSQVQLTQQMRPAEASPTLSQVPRLPDEVHVQNWVRKQTGNSADKEKSTLLRWAKARQKLGQDWDDTQRKVEELALRGVSAASIARSLGLSQGEVQLILAKSSVPASTETMSDTTDTPAQ